MKQYDISECKSWLPTIVFQEYLFPPVHALLIDPVLVRYYYVSLIGS